MKETEIKWIDCPYCSVSGLMSELALIMHVNRVHKNRLPDYHFPYI